ncbi:MAG TPA: hypothetical protein VGC13_03550 [Longimicrobium sp.]|jgi:hypothetical protein|uniref:hypothetical protein n=1 Tax=Longimicrobium sp. TaxID=2029185 RepID=UPI002ED90F7E
MSRGELDLQTLTEIANKLPRFDGWAKQAMSHIPDFLSIGFPHESEIPIAAVSLHDCVHTLFATRFALHEYLACGIYFRYRVEPADELLATSREVYYLDDAALRLYSAAEHLADAVVKMLEISTSQLEPFKKKGASGWARLTAYIRSTSPQSRLHRAFSSLAENPDWRLAIRYRGAWVHNQPPTIRGLGIVYHRRKRWKTSGNKRFLGLIGTGDEPEFTTEELGKAFISACSNFADVFKVVLEEFEEIISAHGFTIEP